MNIHTSYKIFRPHPSTTSVCPYDVIMMPCDLPYKYRGEEGEDPNLRIIEYSLGVSKLGKKEVIVTYLRQHTPRTSLLSEPLNSGVCVSLYCDRV